MAYQDDLHIEFLREYLSGAVSLPPEVQNYLGNTLALQYLEQSSRLDIDPDEMGNFFADIDNQDVMDIHTKILQSDIKNDLLEKIRRAQGKVQPPTRVYGFSEKGEKLAEKVGVPVPEIDKVVKGLQEVGKVRTWGDVANLLSRSVRWGIAELATVGLEKGNRDILDDIQQAELDFRTKTISGYKVSEGSFSDWSIRSLFGSSAEAGRAQEASRLATSDVLLQQSQNAAPPVIKEASRTATPYEQVMWGKPQHPRQQAAEHAARFLPNRMAQDLIGRRNLEGMISPIVEGVQRFGAEPYRIRDAYVPYSDSAGNLVFPRVFTPGGRFEAGGFVQSPVRVATENIGNLPPGLSPLTVRPEEQEHFRRFIEYGTQVSSRENYHAQLWAQTIGAEFKGAIAAGGEQYVEYQTPLPNSLEAETIRRRNIVQGMPEAVPTDYFVATKGSGGTIIPGGDPLSRLPRGQRGTIGIGDVYPQGRSAPSWIYADREARRSPDVSTQVTASPYAYHLRQAQRTSRASEIVARAQMRDPGYIYDVASQPAVSAPPINLHEHITLHGAQTPAGERFIDRVSAATNEALERMRANTQPGRGSSGIGTTVRTSQRFGDPLGSKLYTPGEVQGKEGYSQLYLTQPQIKALLGYATQKELDRDPAGLYPLTPGYDLRSDAQRERRETLRKAALGIVKQLDAPNYLTGNPAGAASAEADAAYGVREFEGGADAEIFVDYPRARRRVITWLGSADPGVTGRRRTANVGLPDVRDPYEPSPQDLAHISNLEQRALSQEAILAKTHPHLLPHERREMALRQTSGRPDPDYGGEIVSQRGEAHIQDRYRAEAMALLSRGEGEATSLEREMALGMVYGGTTKRSYASLARKDPLARAALSMRLSAGFKWVRALTGVSPAENPPEAPPWIDEMPGGYQDNPPPPPEALTGADPATPHDPLGAWKAKADSWLNDLNAVLDQLDRNKTANEAAGTQPVARQTQPVNTPNDPYYHEEKAARRNALKARGLIEKYFPDYAENFLGMGRDPGAKIRQQDWYDEIGPSRAKFHQKVFNVLRNELHMVGPKRAVLSDWQDELGRGMEFQQELAKKFASPSTTPAPKTFKTPQPSGQFYVYQRQGEGVLFEGSFEEAKQFVIESGDPTYAISRSVERKVTQGGGRSATRVIPRYGEATSLGRRYLIGTDLPAGARSEEGAFGDATNKMWGIAHIGAPEKPGSGPDLSYIRLPLDKEGKLHQFLTVEEQMKKDPLVRNKQVGYTREGVAFHETGHHIQNAMIDKSSKFGQEWREVIKKTPHERLLSKLLKADRDVHRQAEEFAQSYAVIATYGMDALAETHPEYADYFKKHEKVILAAEAKAPPIIDFSDDPANPRAYKVSARKPTLRNVRARQEGTYAYQGADLDDLDPEDRAYWERIFAMEPPQDTQQTSPFTSDEQRAQAARQLASQQQQTTRAGAAANQADAMLDREGLRSLGSWINVSNTRAIKSKQLGPAIDQTTVPRIGGVDFGGQLGFENLSEEHATAGLKGASAAWDFATGGSLPTDRKSAVGTVQARLNQFINDYVNKYADEVLSKNIDPQDLQETKQNMRHMMKQATDPSMRMMGTALFGTDQDEFRAARYRGSDAYRIRNAAELRAYAARNQNVADYLADYPGGAEEAMKGSRTVMATGGGGAISFGGGGTGQGGGQQRPNRFQTLWGGSLGRALYSSYIAKRFWSMTMGSMMQDAQYYGQGLQAMGTVASVGLEDSDFMRSDEGYMQRQIMARQYYGRGAMQQFGAFQEIPYALSGDQGSWGRFSSGMRLGAMGVAGGFIAAQTMSMFGGSQSATVSGAAKMLGGAAAPALLLGGAIMAGTGLMEGYNMFAQPDVPVSWGNMARNALREASVTIGAHRYASGWGGLGGNVQGPWTLEGRSTQMGGAGPSTMITEDQAKSVWSQRWQDFIGHTDISPQLKGIGKLTGRIQSIVGGEETEIAPSLRALARGLGPLSNRGNEALIERMAEGARYGGYTFSEFTQAGISAAGQMGYMPGTAGYQQYLSQYAQPMTPYQRAQMDQQAQVVARYSGMVSSYYNDPSMASALVRGDYGNAPVTTQPQAQAIQSLLAAAGQYNVSADDVYGYGLVEQGGISSISRPITWGEQIAKYSEGRGNYFSQLDASAINLLTSSGMGFDRAFNRVSGIGFQNEVQVGQAAKFINVAQQFGPVDADLADRLMGQSQQQNAYQTNIIANMAEQLYAKDIADPFNRLSGLGLSNSQMGMFGKMFGGDIQAWSNFARMSGNGAYQFRNEAGQSIAMTNMAGFMSMVTGQATLGNQAALQWFGGAVPQGWGSMSTQEQLAYRFDEVGAGYTQNDLNTLANGGVIARQLQHQRTMNGYQQAGIGIQMAQIALQRDYLWGGSAGSWQNPSANSLWGLQDRMRNMQYSAQMAEFQATEERMTTMNEFAVRGEGIQLGRMRSGHQFQRWQRGFDAQGMALNQRWAREDWAYQDQMRDLSFSWQMEDLNDAIRMSSGRQRKQYVKQKERAAIVQNLEEERTEAQREKQETVWSREEERFEKQAEYAEQLMEYDEEQFDLQKESRETLYQMDVDNLERRREEYEKQQELQQKIIEKQREHQAKSLELQEAALGVQAAAAAEQARYNEQMEALMGLNTEMETNFKNMVEAHPEEILYLMEQVAKATGETDPQILEAEAKVYLERQNSDTAILEATKDWIVEQNKSDVGTLTAQREMLEEQNKVPASLVGALEGAYAEFNMGSASQYNAAREMFGEFNNVSSGTANAVSSMLKALDGLNTGKITSLKSLITAINSANSSKMAEIRATVKALG